MDARVRVVEIRDGRAHVACDEQAGCGGCAAGGCGLRWLFAGGPRALELPAGSDRERRLRPGEAVRLVLPDGELLSAVAKAYLPMLAGLLVAPSLAAMIWSAGEAALLAAAAAGGALGWLATRLWFRSRPPAFAIVVDEDVPFA